MAAYDHGDEYRLRKLASDILLSPISKGPRIGDIPTVYGFMFRAGKSSLDLNRALIKFMADDKERDLQDLVSDLVTVLRGILKKAPSTIYVPDARTATVPDERQIFVMNRGQLGGPGL